MWERIKYIIIKEFIQMLRDRKMRIVIFLMPCFQMLILGNAVSTDVKDVSMAVYDLDRTYLSRELTQQFVASKYFINEKEIANAAGQKKLIDESAITMVLHIDRGFMRAIEGGKTALLQLIVDGTNSNTAGIVLQYANNILQKYAANLARAKVNQQIKTLLNTVGIPQIDLRSRVWFNENLVSQNFFIPGIVALIVFTTTLLLTAMAIVREKEMGTIEQLIVSPIRPLELILGKLIPVAAVGIIDIFLVTGLMVLFFHVPLRGSLVLLFFSSSLFLLTTLGLGLYISTRADTQQEALMSMFLCAQPLVLLSGFVFPIANMPQIIQLVTYVNPLRYFLVIVRGIFLKRSGIDILWPQMLALLIIGAIIIALSCLRFNKRLG